MNTYPMDRRHLLKTIAVLVAVAAVVCMTPTNVVAADRPNIILVMTDDQGYGDLACHGHPFLKTPNLDKLYAQSTRFTDFHVSSSCAPTRAALMSGRAPFKVGVTHTIWERERMSLKATTIAQVLKGAGYSTGIFGKWHLGDEDEYQPHNRGFEETFIHGGSGIGMSYPGSQADAPGSKYFDPIIKHNNVFVQTKGYCTDVFFRQALGWVKKCKDKGERFFAYVPTNAPHGPFIVDKKYQAMYKGKFPDAPRWLGPDRAAAFFGMITNIDDNMGLLMKKLDEWDLANNTLLIFMTDNGSTVAAPFNYGMKGKKGMVNEGGTRVPLFLRLPGRIKSGVDVDRLTRHVDIFPTLAEFSGVTIPKEVALDGRSLVPLINNPKAKWTDRHTFFHLGRWGKKGGGMSGKPEHKITDPDKAKYKDFAVRNEKWRYVGVWSRTPDTPAALYDIDNDPGEKKNVIEQHPEIARKMLKAYDAWWDEVRPLMVNEDASLNKPKPFRIQFEKQKRTTGIPDWNPPQL